MCACVYQCHLIVILIDFPILTGLRLIYLGVWNCPIERLKHYVIH